MKATLSIIIVLFALSVSGQGFYNRYKDPQGKYMKDSCYCPQADTNHYSLEYAPNGVDGGSWNLRKSKKDTYDYPVHGWRWADSKKEAKIVFKLKKDKALKDTTDNVPEIYTNP